ncbi:MAG: ATP synthase F1 subunit delta [Actinomycetota bacterium]|nr:ATP synthase F1 subunit delta [Actinomycetota bacterium]
MNPALQGYLAAVAEELVATGDLATGADQLSAVAAAVDGSSVLLLVMTDDTITAAARRAVIEDVLDAKVSTLVRRLVGQAAQVTPAAELPAALHGLASHLQRWASGDGFPSGEAEEPLGRMAARHRVGGYAAAVFASLAVADIEGAEDELFRFTRIVEAHRPLRAALSDRELAVPARLSLVADLLGTQASEATRRLVAYAIRGGRARDIVSTLDFLIEEAARARGWRVARVQAAEAVDESQQHQLAEALGRLAGAPVELQITVDPVLLGGVVVEVGDLLIDGSVRHRLDQLKERVLVSEASYRARDGREGT